MKTFHISEEDLSRILDKALQPIASSIQGYRIYQEAKISFKRHWRDVTDYDDIFRMDGEYEEVYYGSPYVFIGELMNILRNNRIDFRTEAKVLDTFAKGLEEFSEESL